MSRVGVQVRTPPLPPPLYTLKAFVGPRKASFSGPHSSHQATAGSQILPGDEIVQINEQVVVSDRERGEVDVRCTKEVCVWGQSHPESFVPCKDQSCGSCPACHEPPQEGLRMTDCWWAGSHLGASLTFHRTQLKGLLGAL